jgi:UDP-N-acetylglucosamine--N-acetylmuramyl-(pentapeptide) pyrophosphoryl-undecaprenol N-acetylglucosamine transferase
MKALIAGGGTGGHFYPGYAAALELKKRGWQLIFIVKENDPAIPTLEAAGLPWTPTDLTGMARSLNPAKHFALAVKLAKSVSLARHVIADWKPDIVIGTGGYVSFPAIFAAKLAGVPSMIHESNAIFGLANGLCAKIAAKVALGLPLAKGQLKTAQITGTPVRAAFAALPDRKTAAAFFSLDAAKKTVLVFGGSQGALGLNTGGLEAEKICLSKMPDLQFLHIAGKKAYPQLAAQQLPAGIKLVEYCDAMQNAFAASDFIVCRSGASTAAELIAAKKPAILVPLPTAAANHQEYNARTLVYAGCALMVKEGQDFTARLSAAILSMTSGETAAKMGQACAASGFADPLKAAGAMADMAQQTASHAKS